MKQYAAVDDTVYFWFAGNDTSGSGGDGASPAADVRLAGAAADAAPVYSPTPSLLSHVNYPAGAYEIAITASIANGFATGNTYAVFCTLAIDSQNPTGFVGSFDLKPVSADAIRISGDSTAADNAEFAFDGTGYGFTNCTIPTVSTLSGHTAQTGDSFARLGAPAAASIAADLLAIDNFVDELETRLSAARAGYLDNLSAGAVALASGVDLTSIHGAALTETVNGYLAAAFTKLFDVVTPVLTSESVNQSANNNTILAHTDYGLAKLVRSTTPANALDISATGEAGLDFNNIKNAAGAHTLTNITIPTVSALTGKTGFSLLSTGADLILKDSTFALAIADAIWDEILTGAEHNIATSAGLRIRQIGAYAIHDGTAQAGGDVQITLAATASAIDGTYNRNLMVLTDNTGVGQTRTIIDYNGTTKIAIIDREWRTNPDATSEYQIVADDTPLVSDQGIAQAGTSNTITLRAYASATNDIYLCNVVIIVAGTGRGQARLAGSYNGTTKVITICGDNWTTTPDNTSVYVMIPYGASCACCICDYALGQINTQCDTALTDYNPPTRTEATTDKDAIITEVNANETKIDTLQTDSTAIKTKTDNLPSGIAKNVALPKFDFYMVLSSDHVTGATGKTITGEISKDGGVFAGITNAITEVGSGMYKIASGFTQAEMNANVITLKFTETDCDQRTITLHTT